MIAYAPVIDGAALTVPLTARQALGVTLMVESKPGMKTALKMDPNLTAPIAQGQRVGVLTVSAPQFPGLTVPVYASESVPQANIAVRLWRKAKGLIGL